MSKIEIPKHLYAHDVFQDTFVGEQETRTPVEKLSWDQGIFLWLKGAEYPQKGLTSPEAGWAMNMAKKNFIELLKVFALKEFRLSWFLVLFYSHKKKVKFMEKLIASYQRQTWGVVSPYVLKTEYMTPVAQEVLWMVYSFFKNLGVLDEYADRVAVCIATIVEYDNAYRYRIQDIFSETTKEQLLRNPRKEIERLVDIVIERDAPEVAVKFKYIGYALRALLFFGKFKKAMLYAISEISIRKLSFDEGDRYWACFRKDYKFFGKSYEERQVMLGDKSRPVMQNIK